MSSTSSSSVIKVITDQLIKPFTTPSRIICDNATYFSSNEFIRFATNNNITIRYSSYYHPTSHGKVEVAHFSILRIIAQLLEDYHDDVNWTHIVQHSVFAYNNSYNISLGLIPIQQVYNKDNNIFISNILPIIQLPQSSLQHVLTKSINNRITANEANSSFNIPPRVQEFKVGSLVRYRLMDQNSRLDKLAPLYSELHIITKQVSPYSFIIRLYDSDTHCFYPHSKELQYNVNNLIHSYDN